MTKQLLGWPWHTDRESKLPSFRVSIPSDDPFSFGERKNKQKAFLCSVFCGNIWLPFQQRSPSLFSFCCLSGSGRQISAVIYRGSHLSVYCPGPKPRDSCILIPEHWPQNHLTSVIRKLALTCLNVLPESNAGGHATIWLMISLSVMNPVKRNQVCSNLKGLSGRQA